MLVVKKIKPGSTLIMAPLLAGVLAANGCSAPSSTGAPAASETPAAQATAPQDSSTAPSSAAAPAAKDNEGKPSLAPGETVRVEYIVSFPRGVYKDRPAEMAYGKAGQPANYPPNGWAGHELFKITGPWSKEETLVIPEAHHLWPHPELILQTFALGAHCEIRINGVVHSSSEPYDSNGARCKVHTPSLEFRPPG